MDEPVEIEQYEYEDNTDYESLDQYYSGTWIDKNNGLTMFIQKIDDIDHSYLINIQSSDKQMSATGRIQTNGEMIYTVMIVDGVEVEQGTFNAIVESNGFSDIANSDHDIKLYYSIATAEG